MGVLDRFRLDGRRLFVTGGSRGLGREMALACAEAGADVILSGRGPESLAATADDIRARGRSAWTIEADIGVPESCEAACRQTLDLGPVDILINNVGGRQVSVPIEETSLDLWKEMLDLNLTSTFLCTKIVGGAMIGRGQGGRIINIGSISGMIANRGIAGRHYETAKAAVIQFTRAIAVDWAPHGITVNAISPGVFMTEPNRSWAAEQPAAIEGLLANTPVGRAGDPEDLGPLAVYLASDAARFVTGANFVIDGGYTVW